MTLAELLTLSLATDQLRGLAVVFSAELRDRLVSVQAVHGSPCFTVFPAGPTYDGRYYHCADIVAEVAPNGMYGQGFANLEKSRFNEVEVMTIDDAIALMPTP